MASRVGIEPTTQGLKVPCSTAELPARKSHYQSRATMAELSDSRTRRPLTEQIATGDLSGIGLGPHPTMRLP
jgi:hypothetical protein